MAGLLHISLVSGPLPWTITVTAFGVLAYLVAGSDLAGWRQVALFAAGSLGIFVAVGTAVGIEHRVGSTFPRSFFVWAALPLFAAAVAIRRWQLWRWTRRLLALTAVLLLTLFGLESINMHYAYVPTVGDAVGQPIEDQVPARAITQPTTEHALRNAAHGVVIDTPIPGVVSGFRSRAALVWLPPAYFRTPRPMLPVIEMLAGVPGGPPNLLRAAHAGITADAYAASHGGWAPILVFPDQNGSFLGDTECVDGPRGNAETYLTVDVPRFAVARFGAERRPATWGIAGYSEGGTCAVTLGLRHPDLFTSFLDIAGDAHPNAAYGRNELQITTRRLYGGNSAQFAAHDPARLIANPRARHLHALFAAGRRDRKGVNVESHLAELAAQHDLSVALRVDPGGHTFALVHRSLGQLFPVLADEVMRAAQRSTV